MFLIQLHHLWHQSNLSNLPSLATSDPCHLCHAVTCLLCFTSVVLLFHLIPLMCFHKRPLICVMCVEILQRLNINECENSKYLSFFSRLPLWSAPLQMLARQCERYQGEELFCRQQTLVELGRVQERWLNMSLQLFRRHSSPEGEPPANEPVLRELVKLLPELLKQLDTQATGETGERQQRRQ